MSVLSSLKNKTQSTTLPWWRLWSCEHREEETNDNSKVTREKILMAAFDEVYHRGFQAASLSNILKNTSTTKGALYHHFKNKMELGYAIVDEVIHETIKVNWIDPLNKTDDPITTIRHIMMTSGELMTAEDVSLGCPLNNLTQEMSPIDDGFRQRISDVYEQWQIAVEGAFERGKKAGNFDKNVDASQLALLFVATLEGCMGFAKSTQNLDTLMNCGQGLMDRLESLRPSK